MANFLAAFRSTGRARDDGLLQDEKKPAVFPGTLTLLTWLGYESDYEACMALLPPGFIAQGADKLLPANFTCLHTQVSYSITYEEQWNEKVR